MKFKTTLTSAMLIGGILITNAEADSSKAVKPNRGEAVIATSEAKAVVKEIDYKSRKVTLKSSDGEEFSFIAGDKIKNLEQVKKGDIVRASVMEAVVFEIKKGGKASAPVATEVTKSARPGSKPQGVTGIQMTSTIVITAIDKKTPSVTFKNASGETQTFKVRHPERLEGVKVGDTVDITYSEAVALKVEKTSKQ